MDWVLYLLVGSFAGVLAGLFGVGGGAIIVPILIVIFSLQGFAEQSLVHVAVGTSFATIVITSASSILAHHKLGNILWPVVRLMAPGLMLGVVLGSIVASSVAGTQLQLAIAVFLMLVAVQMFSGLQPPAAFGLPGAFGLATAGGVIGGASAFFGIGGGSLTVPFLSAARASMHNAVATSAACGFPIALLGALTYGYQGLKVEGLPAFSSGYIYWPAFAGIAIASMPCAKLGAKLAMKLPEKILKRSFALLLFGIGFQLLRSG